MHVDTSQLDGEYPPTPECQMNSSDCSFTPVDYLCHECGRQLCRDCAVGIGHQPRMFKYVRSAGAEEQQVQIHCEECAQSHEYNTQLLAAGGGGVVLGLLFLYVAAPSLVPTVLGLALLAAGGYLIYHEYQLKSELEASEIGA